MTVVSVPSRSGALLLHGDADLAAVGDARHAVEAWLAAHDVVGDDATMIAVATSELVTNAVRHARSGFVVSVGSTSTGVTVVSGGPRNALSAGRSSRASTGPPWTSISI